MGNQFCRDDSQQVGQNFDTQQRQQAYSILIAKRNREKHKFHQQNTVEIPDAHVQYINPGLHAGYNFTSIISQAHYQPCTHQNKQSVIGSQYINYKPIIQAYQKKYPQYLKKLIQKRKQNSIDNQGELPSPLKKEKKQQTLQTLQNYLKTLFTQIINEKFQAVTQQKINITMCKTQIAQSFLSILIEPLQIAIKQNAMYKQNILSSCTFQHTRSLFIKLQQFSKKLTCFLKTKFPRGHNIDAGKLSQEFKEFDCTEEYKYDMIANANVLFKTNNSQNGQNQRDVFQITNNIKIFLNRIMDQIDNNYDKFCNLFQKEIHPNFKVNRKISQNTARCSKLDTGIVEITSIQVARVLIKWLQNLQDIIKKPQEVFHSDYEAKLAKVLEFDTYSSIKQMNFKPDENKKLQNKIYMPTTKKIFQQFLNETSFITKLKERCQEHKQEDKNKFQKYFQEFSIYLLKNIENANLNQRQISVQQMHIVKYAYEINNLISWIVQEKLINIIKILTNLTQKYKNTKGILNLIKFKVNDLMRCRFQGNQKQIKEVYQKILQQQMNGNIDIVKIKNRFHTQNHDAMIFFKMKDSFLICECQLALSEEKSENDKMTKNIYQLNHFLYELQRSPFGTFGQLCVYIKTFSHTVSSYYKNLKLQVSAQRIKSIQNEYKNKISTNKKNQNRSIIKSKRMQSTLAQQKSKIQRKQELKPFSCSLCLKYFHKFANNNKEMKKSQKTISAICQTCYKTYVGQSTENINPKDLINQRKNYFIGKIKNNIMENVKDQNNPDKQFSLQFINYQKIFYVITEQQIIKNMRKYQQNITEQTNMNEQLSSQSISDNSNQLSHLPKNQQKQVKLLKRQDRIKVQNLMQFFQKIQFKAIEKGWNIYFCVCDSIGSFTNLILYVYHPHESVIFNVYSPIEKYYKQDYFQLDHSSTILLLKNVWKTCISKNQIVNNKNKMQKQIQQISRIFKEANDLLVSSDQSQDQQNSVKHDITRPRISRKNTVQDAIATFFQQSITQNKIEPSIKQILNLNRSTQRVFSINQLDSPRRRTSKFKSIKQNCLFPFAYQKQIIEGENIDIENYEFYYAQFPKAANKQKNNQRILFFIDVQKPISKGQNGFLNKLLNLPKIRNLKKNIDLSNIGGNSKQLQILTNIFQNKMTQDYKSNLKQTTLQEKDLISKYFNSNLSFKESPLQWMQNIEKLNLSKNYLTSIKTLSTICPNLQYLNVSQNEIKSLNFKTPLTKLKTFIASDNIIQYKIKFSKFPNVQTLDLSKNNINDFRFNEYCSKLQTLDLSSNNIADLAQIDEVINKKLQYFKTLLLNNNKIKILNCNKLPKRIHNLQVQNNMLQKVDNISSLNELINLNLSFNYLKQLSIPLQLEKLYLSKNQIEKLNCLENCKLKYLNVSQNKLNDQKFQQFILKHHQFMELQTLKIKKNELTRLHDFVKYFPKIKHIALNSNPIYIKNNQNSDIDDYGVQKEEQQEDFHIIQNMLMNKINFNIPIRKSLITQNPLYIQVLKELFIKFDGEINFQYYQNQQIEEGSNKKQYFQQKPSYKLINTHLYKNQNQIIEDDQFSIYKIPNYLYLMYIYEDEYQMSYCFRLDTENTHEFLYQLFHPSIKINLQLFFSFDWAIISYIDLRQCQINNQGWIQFVNHGHTMSNLRKIDIASNDITQVYKQQLEQFPSLYAIWFYDTDEHIMPQLSQASKQSIQRFNQTYRPNKWVITTLEYHNKYEQNNRYNKL